VRLRPDTVTEDWAEEGSNMGGRDTTLPQQPQDLEKIDEITLRCEIIGSLNEHECWNALDGSHSVR
jgi:hypothetical protein